MHKSLKGWMQAIFQSQTADLLLQAMQPEDALDAGIGTLTDLIPDQQQRIAIRLALLRVTTGRACRYFTEDDAETTALLRTLIPDHSTGWDGAVTSAVSDANTQPRNADGDVIGLPADAGANLA
jgi:hypothetical protein